MYYSHNIEQGGRCYSARYCGGFHLPSCSTRNTRILALPVYQQLDFHSCGFVAARAVLPAAVDPDELVATIGVNSSMGADPEMLVNALCRFGMEGTYESGLSFEDAAGLIFAGKPLIVTMRRRGQRDHWAVLAGLRLYGCRRAYLVNDGLSLLGVPVKDFLERWIGDAVVC